MIEIIDISGYYNYAIVSDISIIFFVLCYLIRKCSEYSLFQVELLCPFLFRFYQLFTSLDLLQRNYTHQHKNNNYMMSIDHCPTITAINSISTELTHY